MFQTTLVNPCISSLQNEHSELLQKYSQVCQYVHYLSDVIKQLEKKIDEMIAKHERNKDKVPKKCKFFDTGFCKNRENCAFLHPTEICEEYLDSGKCSNFKGCTERHPRQCRYWQKKRCFHNQSCLYLHSNTLNPEDKNVDKESSWDEKCDDDNKVEFANEEEIVVHEKSITIEVNGKILKVSRMEEIAEEDLEAMTTDDFLKFCEDNLINETVNDQSDGRDDDNISTEDILKLYE